MKVLIVSNLDTFRSKLLNWVYVWKYHAVYSGYFRRTNAGN